MLALEGIKVLDLSGGYPTSYGTNIMADFGAEVINVDGRPLSHRASSEGDEAAREAAYSTINRNKKSIVLNLKAEEGREIFYRLVKEADVILDPFRPGVTKRLGIDYETVSKVNPKIIYCSATGYGQDGPYSSFSGHGNCYEGLAGFLNLVGEPDRKPVLALNLVADIAGGALYSLIGICIAIIARQKTGKGQHIDVSYMDSVISMMTAVMTRYLLTDILPERGYFPLPGFPGVGTYETKDGKLITIAGLELRLWQNLCKAMDREDFLPYNAARKRENDPADEEKYKEMSEFFKSFFLTKTRDEWFEEWAPLDVPIGKVYELNEVENDPHVLAREMLMELDHPTQGKVKQVGYAFKMSDTPGSVRNFAPLNGENTDDILKDLGYDQEEIEILRQKGAVS